MRTSDRILLKRRGHARWFERSRPAWHRISLRENVAFCDALAEMLTRAGIDPARCRMLRLGHEAAGELAALPDTPELQKADLEMMAADPMPGDGRPPPAYERDLANLRRIAQGFANGEEPDFARCSLMEAYAFCVARLDPAAWGLTPGAAPAAADRTPSPSMGEGRGGGEGAPQEVPV